MRGDRLHSQSNKRDWPSWVLWLLALAALAYLVGLTVWLGVAGLLFPYQLDFGEGLMLHFVKVWAHGRPIYRTIEEYPYITSNYAPLTLLLALALTPVLGITYAAGRIWTLLAIAVVAAIIVAWVRREGGRWLPALAAAFAFVGSPYIYHWAPLFRVDLIGLALTLAGLYVVWRGEETDRPGLHWVAMALFVAALYAKQSFLFAPAAALAYLFLFGNRWRAVKLAAVMALTGGGIFVLANVLTNGGFWDGLIASNVNPFLWPEFWKQLSDFLGTFALLGLLVAWYVVDKFALPHVAWFRGKRKAPDRNGRDRVGLVDLYLLATLVSLWLAGKAGAWENYFFEALAALALCAGLGIARLANYGRFYYRVVAPLLILVQVGLMWHTPRVADRYLQLTRQSNQEIAPLLAQVPDPIVSEDMGLLVTNDRALDYYSFQRSQLARAGRWDQAWELGQLRDGNFSMVILEQGTRLDVDRYQRFTREFLSELDRSYAHTRAVGKYELYQPDPLQHERRAAFGDQLALVGWSVRPPANFSAPGASGQSLQPRDMLSLTVVWQAQQAVDVDFTAFAHLVDEGGQGWAGDDHAPYEGLYPTSAWGSGEMVRDTFTLQVPPAAPPGLYHIEVGWYHPATQERLPVGEGNTFPVAVLPVAWTGTVTDAVTPVGACFGGVITLEGYRQRVNEGAVQVTLRWSAETYLDADYTVFLHLLAGDDDARVLAQDDAPPLGGRWPTSLWLPGVPLDDSHVIPLAPDLPPGTYHLLVGLYAPATGDRLMLPDGKDALDLTAISLP